MDKGTVTKGKETKALPTWAAVLSSEPRLLLLPLSSTQRPRGLLVVLNMPAGFVEGSSYLAGTASRLVYTCTPPTAQAPLRAGAELLASVKAVTRLGHSGEGGGRPCSGTDLGDVPLGKLVSQIKIPHAHAAQWAESRREPVYPAPSSRLPPGLLLPSPAPSRAPRRCPSALVWRPVSCLPRAPSGEAPLCSSPFLSLVGVLTGQITLR